MTPMDQATEGTEPLVATETLEDKKLDDASEQEETRQRNIKCRLLLHKRRQDKGTSPMSAHTPSGRSKKYQQARDELWKRGSDVTL